MAVDDAGEGGRGQITSGEVGNETSDTLSVRQAGKEGEKLVKSR